MKALFIALLCIATLPSLAQVDSLPIKKANTILLATTISDEELYRKVGGYLLSAGYVIDKSDATLKSMTTEERKIPGVNCYYKINASISSGKVRLSGGFYVPELGKSLSVIENRGQNKSPAKSSFEALDKVAVGLKKETAGVLIYAVNN